MLKRFLLILSLFISTVSSAQLYDSLHSYLNAKPSITGDFGSVQTFFYGFKAPITYVDVGLSFSGRIRLGLGYSWLKVPKANGNLIEGQMPFYMNKYFSNPLGYTDTVNAKLYFGYFVSFIEYVFYKSKHWEFSVPLRVGMGNVSYKYSYEGKDQVSDKYLVFIYRPSVSFDYRLNRWIGFNTEIGYKFTFTGQRSIRKNFSSPIYNLGFFIYYSEIYKIIKNKHKNRKKEHSA